MIVKIVTKLKEEKEKKKRKDEDEDEPPKKKKRKNVEDEEDEQVKIRRKYEEEFENIKQGITVRRKKKSASIPDDEVKDFVKRMWEADTNDGIAVENNQPAINKLTLCDELVSRLSKKPLHQKYIDGGILLVFRNWLLPQGNILPNLKIRTIILTILTKMNIKETVILHSQINQVIKILAKHQKETKENKKLANTLLKKWSNPLSVDYRRHFKHRRSVTSSKKKLNNDDGKTKQPSRLQEMLKNMEKGTRTKAKNTNTMGITKLH